MIDPATSRVPVWEPVQSHAGRPHQPKVVTIPNERAILDALEAPVAIGETISIAYRKLEHALGALFAQLTPIEARALHKRLSTPSPDDAIATRFGRMVQDRRQRLLAFLADAPRRAALSGRR